MARINPIQLQKFLGGIDYPAEKKTLLDTARKQGADENAMLVLEQLPEQKYNSPNDVSEAVGKLE